MVKSRGVARKCSMGALGAIVISAGIACGQDYASKPIRIVTGSAGGSSDFTTRQIAQALSASLGQQVIVDNRTAVMQTEIVSKAPPDGYTLLVAGGPLWILPLLRQTPYDPVKDFSPVMLIELSVNLAVVHPSVPVTSVKELIALAKARPGEINYASAGMGTTSHLATELFKSMAAINMLHVPYKGNGPALTDLIGGQVQLSIMSAPSATQHVKSGRLRAIAVTSLQPSALAPGLPAVAATVPGYESVGITGLFAPARLPGAIIKRLNDDIVRFLRTAEAKEIFFRNGSEVVGSSPEQLAAAIALEMERLGKVIRNAGIRAE